MSEETKKCPYCAEEIKADAIKCRYCSSILETPPTVPYDTLDLPLVSTPTAADRVLSGRYRIVKQLGRGGMGVVYLARDEELDMEVAIKFLPVELANDRRALEQLRSEAKLSMALSHDNIMRLHNLDTSGQFKFLVMEYVDGPNLLEKLRGKERLSFDEVLPIIKAVCRGLEYAHSKRVLHRDLKPANIMLTIKGEIKITDFGIARQMRESMSQLSQKTISGTPAYMAPEHIMGEHLTVRSEVYSLGAMAYELLSGRPPFFRGDILAQIRFKEPQPIPGVPDAVNRVILNSLSKKAEDRPASATAFYEALAEATLECPASAVPGAAVGPAQETPGLEPTVRSAVHEEPSEEYVLSAASTGAAEPAAVEAAPASEAPAMKSETRHAPLPAKSHAWVWIVAVAIIAAGCLGIFTYMYYPFFFGKEKEIPVEPGDGIHHVPADFSTIQEAINSSSDGDTVIVADGTYVGASNRNIDFAGRAITLKSENGPGKCIIDCDNSGRGFFFHSGENAGAVVEGFTIQNGRTMGSDGAGMHCSGSSPTIRYCIIKDNVGVNGDGIYCEKNSCPAIVNCIIAGNSGWYGGGIYCLNSSPVITGCTIVKNGGGVVRGGGVYCEGDSSITINNTVLYDNISAEKGSQIYAGPDSAVTLNHCCLPDTARDPDRFGGNGTVDANDKCVYADPKLIDAAGGDYRLQLGSPCFNAGDNGLVPEEAAADMGGNPRFANGTVDIGAYEYRRPERPAGTLSAFGRSFSHESHSTDCGECHMEKAGEFALNLEGRGACRACHHAGVESADECEGCHESQAKFYQGVAKFGFDESPSLKFACEIECSDCHGDVKEYVIGLTKVNCSACHEEDEYYSYQGILARGKKAIEDTSSALKETKTRLEKALKSGKKSEQIEEAEGTVSEARDILDFLKKEGSFGFHNPMLFDEYIDSAKSYLKQVNGTLDNILAPESVKTGELEKRYSDAIENALKCLDADPGVPTAESVAELIRMVKEVLATWPQTRRLVADAEAALAAFKQAQNNLVRTHKLHDKMLVSNAELDEAQTGFEKEKAQLEHAGRLLQYTLDEERYDRAITSAREALEIKPGDPQAQQLLDEAENRKGKLVEHKETSAVVREALIARTAFDQSEKDFNQLRDLFEKGIVSERELVKAKADYERDKLRFYAAKTDLLQALMSVPDHPAVRELAVRWLLEDARAVLEKDDVQAAQALIQQILAADPDNEEARALKRKMIMDKGSSERAPVLRPEQAYRSAGFSPDLCTLVSGGADKTVRLRDMATGREKRVLKGHAEPVASVCVSPNGRTVASGSLDKSVKVWDVATGRLLQTLTGHTGTVGSVCFSPDGAFLASGADDGKVKIWLLVSGEEVRTLDALPSQVNSVCYSPDGRVLASAGSDNAVRLWNPSNGKIRSVMRGHEEPVTSLAFSPDCKTLASGSRDTAVRLWEVSTGKHLRVLKGHKEWVCSVGFNHDGSQVASGCLDGSVKLWDSAEGKELRTFDAHKGSVLSVRFSPDGKNFASASFDTTAKLHALAGISDIPLTGEGVLGGFGVGGEKKAFGQRQARRSLVSRMGGSLSTESAILAGLYWLQLHQDKDGLWDPAAFSHHCDKEKGEPCDGKAPNKYDVGVTSAALLAFLGSGYTHSAGDYSSTVRRGLDWLRKQQRADGSFKTGSGAEWMYGHALATVVVCEAYAMTGDEKLKDPCLKALGFILKGQNRDGGWRYSPAQGTSDSSVTTSMLVALKAAKDAGLAVPKKTLDRAFAFLDRVTDDKGMTGYVKRGDKTSTKAPVLTAATLLCRLLHGQSGDGPKVKQGIEILRKSIPAWSGAKGDKLEMYYIYWATQAVFHSGGQTWKEWNRAMKKTLLESQRKDGCARGSWNPDGTWVKNGGRVFSTAINCLTLEVYYRYLPVHRDK